MSKNPFLNKIAAANLQPYRSVPFWSWNDKLEPAHLQEQIRDMNDVGMGGFFMHARGGLQTEYMGQEWFEAVDASVEEAKRLGMDAWCYDENGWPSGFAGGALLEDPANWAHFLKFEKKQVFDESALAVYVLNGTKLSRVMQPQTDAMEYLCVYDCTNSSVVDILNPNITDAFIAQTHEKYAEHFGENFSRDIKGFFTDEPQYFRWDTAYTPVLLEVYPARYGEDMLEKLGALFVDCDGAYGFRFRYWRLMNELYCENFMGRIYAWCHDHGCSLTGHSIEERHLAFQMWCCAGIMPFYEYEDIPGIDWLGRDIDTEMTPRQVSSAAQQLGKKQVLTETFACVGWDVTPRELKRIAEWQYVNGVNMMCQHLYPYSVRGQRKRDYPAFYSKHNPWTKKLGQFNDYFTELGYLLAESKEEAPVLVLHPIHSAYLTFDRKNDVESVKELSDHFNTLIEELGSAGIVHHYADERMLEKIGSVENGKITVGKCSYTYWLIPECATLDSSTVTLLKSYLQQGGKLCFAGKKPTMIDGEEADLSFLEETISYVDMKARAALYVKDNQNVRATLRTMEEGRFLYTVNLSQTEDAEMIFKLPFKGVEALHLEDHSITAVTFEPVENGVLASVKLAAGESVILSENNLAETKTKATAAQSVLPLTGEMELTEPVENSITLDYAALSYDGITFTEPMPIMAVSDRLLRERVNRPVWLRYTFKADYLPEKLYLEAEPQRGFAVTVNGVEVDCCEIGGLDPAFRKGNIADALVQGENTVVIYMDYFQPEHVYHVFNEFYYGDGTMTETLINCLAYDTNVEAAYLHGNFTVEAEAGYNRIGDTVLLTDGSFVIKEPVTKVQPAAITTCGFPFFHGTMRLRCRVNLDSTQWMIHCDGRLQYANVFVNGNAAGTILLQNKLDISDYLQVGENVLEFEFMSSNRNIYGPFHTKGDPEPFGVGPDTFSLYGTWNDGASKHYEPSYAMVEFGAQTLQLESKA